MNYLDPILDLLPGDYTVRVVALGAGVLGVVSGALGCFAVLRRQSLLGDAVSHAALPGIVLAFLLVGSKSTLVLLAGALAAGWLSTLILLGIVRATRLKYDGALGLVLSVFFGFGLLLLTYTQRHVATARQAGLDKFLFGQAATLVEEDVLTLGGVGSVALLLVFLYHKEFKLLSFDSDYGASLGFRMRAYDVLLTTLLVVAVVLGLQAVGVVLMSAMLVAPAAAARQWTDRLGRMLLLAAGFGALAGVGGAVASHHYGLPTGPAVVLCLGAVVAVSLLGAPNRGLLWDLVRQRRNRRQLRLDAVFSDLYALARQHPQEERGHSTKVLQAMSVGLGGVERSLEELAERGWARRLDNDAWALTPAGRAEAERRFDTDPGPEV